LDNLSKVMRICASSVDIDIITPFSQGEKRGAQSPPWFLRVIDRLRDLRTDRRQLPQTLRQ